jgi:hypothetical protein
VTRASGAGEVHFRTRREPSGKLPSKPSSKPGVEPIANTNRIVTAVGGEARDKRKRETLPTLPTRSPLTSIQSLSLSPSFESTSGLSRSSTANPSSYSSGLRLRTPHNRGRIALALVNNGDQQHANHTSLAKLFHCFLSW